MGLGLTITDGIIPGLLGTIEFELCCVRLQVQDLMQKKEKKKTKEKKRKLLFLPCAAGFSPKRNNQTNRTCHHLQSLVLANPI